MLAPRKEGWMLISRSSERRKNMLSLGRMGGFGSWMCSGHEERRQGAGCKYRRWNLAAEDLSPKIKLDKAGWRRCGKPGREPKRPATTVPKARVAQFISSSAPRSSVRIQC